jgi:hypothetical protein
MQAQGHADGGKAALAKLYSQGVQCFDLATHPVYVPNHRPSEINAWTDHLLAVPRIAPPQGDPIGGWEDVLCLRDA